MSELLDVQDLQTRFKVRKGYVYAVNGVSFRLEEGETLAVVGESGCGQERDDAEPGASAAAGGPNRGRAGAVARRPFCWSLTSGSCGTCVGARSA